MMNFSELFQIIVVLPKTSDAGPLSNKKSKSFAVV